MLLRFDVVQFGTSLLSLQRKEVSRLHLNWPDVIGVNRGVILGDVGLNIACAVGVSTSG